MRYKSIAGHLRPYSMLARRRTTINHAFAAAIAPSDVFDDARVRQAITMLGQDPHGDLTCAYCGSAAETWDHIFATVKDSRSSGHGHRIGNLLPCCKPCNSKTGNKSWEAFLGALPMIDTERTRRHAAISAFIRTYSVLDEISASTPEYTELDEIKKQVLALLQKGDEIAERIRSMRL
jgi:hypothetical protein